MAEGFVLDEVDDGAEDERLRRGRWLGGGGGGLEDADGAEAGGFKVGVLAEEEGVEGGVD